MVYTNLSRLVERPKGVPKPYEFNMLKIADALAQSSNCSPHKVGAVIFKGKRVLGRGYNRLETHPFQFRFNKVSQTLHAEIHAMINAYKDREDIDGATIAVARRARNGLHGCSFPCNRCSPALKHAGIRRVICFSEIDEPISLEF
jgi:deoxycytidylate deaminase